LSGGPIRLFALAAFGARPGAAAQLLLPPLQVFAQRGAQAIFPVGDFLIGHGQVDMRAQGRKIKVSPASFP
jgi:hypothetical protein